ncbi:MAG TPA: efflux transporter outer membrane subunit [Candidatus Sulfotelmatobacter sp.]|jgi:multidrug efflux system outer membrane protein|nr:efflux transporter outer membrane subunit [Candidatus Sulfotelmatobacter sp.]
MKTTRRGAAKAAVTRKKKLTPIVLALLAGFVVGGCKVGPNYKRPAVQTPTEYRELKDGQQAQVQPQVASYADLPWWQVFQDPELQKLIGTSLKQNYDLQLATERINAARAAVAITRSNLFPQVQGNGKFSGGKEGTFQTKFNFLSLTADAAFQLDFFGKLRRATEASRAELLATEDAQKTVILTLVSDVASDYFALLQLDLELQITKETVTTQEDSVKLTKFRVDHGVATKLDVLQAQQVLDSANATVPDLERQIAQEENAISILLGNYPQGVPRGRTLVEQQLPPEVPAGLSSTLLERRPDIKEAEHFLVAANAEVGVAKAEFFPQISLTGSGGGSFGRSSAFSQLMSSQLGIWSYGAQVSQPIFTGGALRGNLKLAKSQYDQALISYRQAIQQAFGDVSDALIGYEKFHEVRVRQEQTVADLQESVRLSILRYKGGTTTYLEVLDGQRSLFNAELVLAQARGTEFQSLVNLYRALGGGWQQ